MLNPEQIKAGYSTIEGPYDPLSGKPKTAPVNSDYSSGSRFGEIAKSNGISLEDLARYNPDLDIRDPNKIYMGRALNFKPTGPVGPSPAPADVAPGSTPPTDTNTPSNATTTTEAAKPSTYIIKPNDTLTKIANENGTNIQAIMGVNSDIKNPNVIRSGAILNLPGAPKMLPNADAANKYQNSLHAEISKIPDVSNVSKVASAAASVPYGDTLPPAATVTVNDLIGTISKQITDLNTAAPVNLVENYKALSKELGLDELNTQYINLEKVINGTEDDIRAEVTKAGGTMNESQVQALAAARNKSLILKANGIQAAIASKTDTLKTLSGLSVDEQKMANDRVSTAVGLEKDLLQLQGTMQTHAADGYNKIVANVGYTGLAGALAGDPYSQALAEKTLQLPPGTLSNPAALAKLETYRQQTILQGQQKINISVGNAASMAGARDALTLSRYTTATNNTIRALYPTNQNPIQVYNKSSQVINRIDESYKNAIDPKNKTKGPDDLDLLDSYIAIAKPSGQVTQAQFDEITNSLGIKATFDVKSQKVTGTALFDNGTRNEIHKLAHQVYDGQKKLADDGVVILNERLKKLGIPDEFLFKSPEEIGDTTQYQSGTVQVKDKNGQVGTIPADQLEEALSEGYSEVQ